MNPLFQREIFIPDGEARRMPDGRLYIYGSADIPGEPDYCSNKYYVFSTDDMENWKNHGISFQAGMKQEDALKELVTLGGGRIVLRRTANIICIIVPQTLERE